MRNAGLEETQAGIKIAGRSINSLRCADDTTFTEESEEGLSMSNIDNLRYAVYTTLSTKMWRGKSLLMKVKEEREKAGLKLGVQ